MKYKGYNVKYNRHLSWRNGDPSRDVTHYGKPVESNCCVIVKYNDCKVDPIKNVLITKDAPQAFKGRYSRTNMMYTPYKRWKPSKGAFRIVDGVEQWTGKNQYLYRCHVYVVYDARVYSCPIYTRDRTKLGK